MSQVVIEARDLSVFFGELAAVHRVDLTIDYGERVGLVGPNGCGKSTLLNALVRAIKPTTGRVSVGGRRTSGLSPSALVAAGVGMLGRGFQSPYLVGELTIAENCQLAAWGHAARSRSAIALPWRARIDAGADRTADWAMATVGLEAEMRQRKPATVPFGVRKLAEVARVLAARPRFLLLDEPTSGLSREEADQFCEALVNLEDPRAPGQRLGFLVVDHDMESIELLCDEVCLMSEGDILGRGGTAEILTSEQFGEIYLGLAASSPLGGES